MDEVSASIRVTYPSRSCEAHECGSVTDHVREAKVRLAEEEALVDEHFQEVWVFVVFHLHVDSYCCRRVSGFED